MRVIVEDCKKQKNSLISVCIKVVIPVTIVFALTFPIQFAGLVLKVYGYAPGIVKTQVGKIACAFQMLHSTRVAQGTGVMFTGNDLDQAQQMLLVVVQDWPSSGGTMQRYERPPGSGPWNKDGSPIRVVLAGAGLAWVNEKVYKPAGSQDPIKQRNDNRSPAGVFPLGTAFGYDDERQIENLNYDYLRIDSKIFCVDDERLPQYNRLIDRTRYPGIGTDSLRRMFRNDDLYRLGVVINHNNVTPNPDLGSCLFLHSWEEAERPTTGSTTMAYGNMLDVVRWLNRNKQPILVQITARDRGRIPNLPSE